VLEETLRDLRSAARAVDREALSRFSRASDGALSFELDSGYPTLRGLPALPEGEGGSGSLVEGRLPIGASWTASGERRVELGGGMVAIPFLAEYRYLGRAEYRGAAAYKLAAKFATRYRATSGASARGSLLSQATGTHDLEIFLDAGTLAPVFIRDRFDETFTLAAGSTERRSGFALTFFEGSSPLDRAGGLIALREAGPGKGPGAAPTGGVAPGGRPGASGADGDPPGAGVSAGSRPDAPGPGASRPGAASGDGDASTPAGAGPGALLAGGGDGLLEEAGVELGESAAGIVLRVRDLRFVADSDLVLDSELWRLDAIASALAALPGRRFLVEGHSAAVGKAAGELELSKRRAARVAAELVARGIDPGLVMYRGLGSSAPIASNDSEEGRARNRRVEITVLDY